MPINTIKILNFINELYNEQSTIIRSLVRESDDNAKTLTQINQIITLLYKLMENYE